MLNNRKQKIDLQQFLSKHSEIDQICNTLTLCQWRNKSASSLGGVYVLFHFGDRTDGICEDFRSSHYSVVINCKIKHHMQVMCDVCVVRVHVRVPLIYKFIIIHIGFCIFLFMLK